MHLPLCAVWVLVLPAPLLAALVLLTASLSFVAAALHAQATVQRCGRAPLRSLAAVLLCRAVAAADKLLLLRPQRKPLRLRLRRRQHPTLHRDPYSLQPQARLRPQSLPLHLLLSVALFRVLSMVWLLLLLLARGQAEAAQVVPVVPRVPLEVQRVHPAALPSRHVPLPLLDPHPRPLPPRRCHVLVCPLHLHVALPLPLPLRQNSQKNQQQQQQQEQQQNQHHAKKQTLTPT